MDLFFHIINKINNHAPVLYLLMAYVYFKYPVEAFLLSGVVGGVTIITYYPLEIAAWIVGCLMALLCLYWFLQIILKR